MVKEIEDCIRFKQIVKEHFQSKGLKVELSEVVFSPYGLEWKTARFNFCFKGHTGKLEIFNNRFKGFIVQKYEGTLPNEELIHFMTELKEALD